MEGMDDVDLGCETCFTEHYGNASGMNRQKFMMLRAERALCDPRKHDWATYSRPLEAWATGEVPQGEDVEWANRVDAVLAAKPLKGRALIPRQYYDGQREYSVLAARRCRGGKKPVDSALRRSLLRRWVRGPTRLAAVAIWCDGHTDRAAPPAAAAGAAE